MKKTIKHILFSMVASCLVLFSYAQQRTVTGTVTDEQGVPLAGVSYVVKGTKIGGITGENGNFNVEINRTNAVIEFSSVGYKTMSVSVGTNRSLSVKMVQGDGQLEEVVITALGIKRDKKVLGYATATVKGDDMLKAGSVQNPLTALYGQASGVGVEIGSAGPTGGVKINIRGNASLSSSANTRPLIVVDGIPIYDANSGMNSRGYDPLNSFDYGTGINDINGEDIESIEILKGAKATVLYGSLAGNGVLMITTKKGSKTRGLGINLTLQSNIEQPVSKIDWQNEYGSGSTIYDTIYGKDRMGNRVRQLNSSRFQFGPAFDNSPIMNYDSTMTTYHAYPNNYNDLFKNTMTNSATLAISGASEFGNMRLSYTNKDYNGFLDNFYQKNNTISFNGKVKASELASFEVVANLYDVKTHNRYPNIARLTSNGINRDVDFKYFDNFYKDELGQKRILDSYGFPYVFRGDGDGYFNMLWNQKENSHLDDKLHFVGSAKVDLKLHKTISLTGNAGVDFTDWDFITKNKVGQIYPTVSGGSYAFSRQNYKIQNYSLLLNYNNTFFNNKMDVFAFAGPSYYQQDYNSINVQTVGGLQFPDWYALGASQTSSGNFDQTRGSSRSTEKLMSVVGNLSVGWDGTYYVELSARNDWTSTLAPGNNSYFYPGASLSYIFSNNLRLPKLKFGKLRLSVADVGRGAPSAYWAYPSYGLGRVGTTGAITVSTPGSLFSENILPERKREIELGFDTRWFEKAPLEANFSFYTATQYNQIMALGITSTTGWSNIKINAGKVKNWGYEFFAKYTPYQDKRQKLDFSFNIANQYSKVLTLYPGITEYTIDGGGSYKISAIEGKKIGDVRAYDYAKDPNGNKIVNSTGLYGPDNSKLVTVGNINPYLIGGFFGDYFYKNFNVHFGINYKFGGKYLSYTNYYLLGQGLTNETLKYRDEAHGGLPYYINSAGKKIQVSNHSATAPADSRDGHIYHDGLVLDGVKSDGNGGYVKNDIVVSATDYYSAFIHDNSEWFQPDYLYKNDYIKLREISLTYTFPKSISQKVRLQKLAITAFGRNLFYLYKTMPNIDPESALGTNSFVEYSALPQIRTFGLRLDASF